MKNFAEIDPNFKLPEDLPQDLTFYDARRAPFVLYGALLNDDGSITRLPKAFLPECSKGVQRLAYHLAGACVRFSTDATQLGVVWTLRETSNMPHFAASGQSGMELFEETDEGVRQVKNIIPAMNEGHGCKSQQHSLVQLPGGMRNYALYLPLYNGVNEFYLGFSPNAQVGEGHAPAIADPIVFYGSSITQGGCASKVGSCYTTILCRRMDAAQWNLGFSGNGKGEENMAQHIAGMRMSMFVLDYDHNAPNVEHLENTHENFYRIVRAAQPELPIVMVSMPDFDRNREENAKRRAVIYRTYTHAVEAGDERVYFVDGETLFGAHDRDLCTVDGAHPTELGFLRMADALEPVLRKAIAK